MIVPMKKVSLVVLDAERKDALKKLRQLGLVHVEEVQGQGEKLLAYKDQFDTLELAISLVIDLKLPKSSSSLKQLSLNTHDAVQKSVEITNLYDDRKILEDKSAVARAELERLASWGGVDIDSLAYLAKKGIRLYLYQIANDKYLDFPEDVQTIFVNRDKNNTRFLLLGTKEAAEFAVRPESLPADAYAITLPTVSTEQLKKDLMSYTSEITVITQKIVDSVIYKDTLKKALKAKGKSVQFENLFSGMERDNEGLHALAWLTGYLPSKELPTLEKIVLTEKWAMASSDPTLEDEVPTQLKNNRFINIIYPVSDFLGTVPGYREYDISGWFLLFFSIFVGMIFGDAGYGALMAFIAIFAMLGSLTKGKKVQPAINLLLLLGLTTMLWGTLTCNWFGIAPRLLPQVLRSLAFTPFSNAYAVLSLENELWVKQNIQIFCFTLALIQLTIAHLKGMIRYIKSPKFLGDFGSILMIWGMYYVVLNMVVNSTRFSFDAPIPIAALSQYPILYAVGGLIGIGFLLSFMFASYDGSFRNAVLESCKNIVSVMLGVINVFADIVSYIRLWAVGLAGSAISITINEMAGPMLGGFILFAGILLLVFGHGFNMILNVLSVIVHGVRLNTLEFSSHLGMSWSGFNYEPFSNTEAE